MMFLLLGWGLAGYKIPVIKIKICPRVSTVLTIAEQLPNANILLNNFIFFSKKLHIVRNILFLRPTNSLKFIKISRRLAIRQNLKVNSLLAFSVRVFVSMKISLILVSFVCTFDSSMPLFSSFRSFVISTRPLSWIKIGSVNMFSGQSRLLYSFSLFLVIHWTTFFENFPEFEFQLFLQSST